MIIFVEPQNTLGHITGTLLMFDELILVSKISKLPEVFFLIYKIEVLSILLRLLRIQ